MLNAYLIFSFQIISFINGSWQIQTRQQTIFRNSRFRSHGKISDTCASMKLLLKSVWILHTLSIAVSLNWVRSWQILKLPWTQLHYSSMNSHGRCRTEIVIFIHLLPIYLQIKVNKLQQSTILVIQWLFPTM